MTYIARAQEIVINYPAQAYNNKFLLSYGVNKQLPNGYELPILLALSHFPELKDVKIKFELEEGGSFLISKTGFFGLFQKAAKRLYLIHIRTHRTSEFDPILLKNMTLDAQVGAIGHELALTTDFRKRNCFQMLKVVAGHLSRTYLDEQEFSTDQRVIDHGLGFQLFTWRLTRSMDFKSDNMNNIYNSNHRERYMRPETIRQKMLVSNMYLKYHIQIESLTSL